MKVLRFQLDLAKKILDGRKTKTWRMFDDKNLQVGDELEFRVSGNDSVFAYGVATSVSTKTLGTVTEDDYSLGQPVAAAAELLVEFRGYYGDQVTMDTPLKIITFRLTSTPDSGHAIAG